MAKRPDEAGLIETYLAPLAGKQSFSFLDDAAILNIPEGFELVVTSDAIAEGVHFLKGTNPARLAQKAIRVNLSDLAAKGSKPLGVSLSLGLSDDWDARWIENFAEGLGADLKVFGIELTGGDTFRSPGGTVINVTALGAIRPGGYVSRTTAKPGDAVYVSGTIGEAYLGLLSARHDLAGRQDDLSAVLERYELPEPRVQSIGIVSEFASAAMDISDGLVGDLEKLCRASGVGAKIEVQNIPLSAAAMGILEKNPAISVIDLATGGDDYELLITVAAERAGQCERQALTDKTPFRRIGEIVSGNGVEVTGPDGFPIKTAKRSYSHF